MQTIRKSSQQLLVTIVTVVIILSLATAAIANSPRPPDRHWLRFSPDRPALEGVQIVQCESAQCQKPLLIMHYNTCNRSGCIPGAPLVKHSDDTSNPWQPHFGCVDNTCFWSTGQHDVFDLGTSAKFNPNLLKIIAQFPDRVRSTNVFKIPPEESSGWHFGWETDLTIKITPTDLLVSKTADEAEKSTTSNNKRASPIDPTILAILLLVLSVGSEVVIAYFYLCRQQPTKSDLRRFLLSVLLVHLFSLPIVWFSFPALTAFSSLGTRTMGMFWIFMSLLYGAIVTAYYSLGKQPKKTAIWVTGTISFWSLNLLMFVIGNAILNYGVALPLLTGIFLPGAWALPISEVFIWLYEAWIIYAINKYAINYRNAILLSLVTNLTSFSLGSTAIWLGQYLSKI
ncbi:hypothetical protein [Chamaesiphon sp. GL140_3_metabinner_50]|uniref:hypothetical protein n=1 Tax=Chamaesiphon sp. GL140_3_metabinner_50 TaxID=2970812 RepID=UPI0025CEEF41|nr:hypothetical protein [Chamaesiphon sp. GL140_3_metabinner_50]